MGWRLERPIDGGSIDYAIITIWHGVLVVDYNHWIYNHVLSFPTEKMAVDFFSCFKDLCKTAKNLL